MLRNFSVINILSDFSLRFYRKQFTFCFTKSNTILIPFTIAADNYSITIIQKFAFFRRSGVELVQFLAMSTLTSSQMNSCPDRWLCRSPSYLRDGHCIQWLYDVLIAVWCSNKDAWNLNGKLYKEHPSFRSESRHPAWYRTLIHDYSSSRGAVVVLEPDQ